MSDIEREIAKRVDAFVAEISVLLRKSALQQASEILAEQAEAAGGTARRRTKRGKAGKVGNAGRKARAGGKTRNDRRSPEQLEAQMGTLAKAIAGNPGRRIEEIAEEVGEATKELALPIRKLLDAKKIRRKGQRRATRYFPSGKAK